ncbi:hypothetical protein HFO71_33515 [Rhizobium laguerreae]|nr:hypothetical protein [Rhizobium laguerreae]MBY3075205.1 hypothetical protein [Rhizobium laguerreae]
MALLVFQDGIADAEHCAERFLLQIDGVGKDAARVAKSEVMRAICP